MSVIYTSSDGRQFDLTSSMSMRLKEAKFHSFSWSAETTKKRYGETVDRWKKEPWKQPAKILFKGSKRERKILMDRFHTAIERDMFYNTPGRLTWGDWYINCFFVSSDTYPADDNDTMTYNDVEIYAPKPLWISEQSIHVEPVSEIILQETDKQYDPSYGYDYSYMSVSDTSKRIYIDHYAPCDFRAVLHGPQDNVNVTIGNVSLHVTHAIPAGGYIVIDTREEIDADKHCYLVTEGVEINCFNDRDPECTLLEKVEPGSVTVTYNRNSVHDLTIYRERSEPTWI